MSLIASKFVALSSLYMDPERPGPPQTAPKRVCIYKDRRAGARLVVPRKHIQPCEILVSADHVDGAVPRGSEASEASPAASPGSEASEASPAALLGSEASEASPAALLTMISTGWSFRTLSGSYG